jgi:CheY-like chemotaxis protein
MSELEPTVGTLLYIEDDPAAVELMQSLLSRHRPAVRLVIATDGASGRRLAESERPDVIFVDLQLPDVDGVDLLAVLHRLDGAQVAPLVALSAQVGRAAIARAVAAGASSFVAKPVDLQHVLTLVDTFITPPEDGRPVSVHST